jgi:hypothetical protein
MLKSKLLSIVTFSSFLLLIVTQLTIKKTDCGVIMQFPNLSPSDGTDCATDSKSYCCYVETTDSVKVCKSVYDSKSDLQSEQEKYIKSVYTNVKNVSCPFGTKPLTKSTCNTSILPTSSKDCRVKTTDICCYAKTTDPTPLNLCVQIKSSEQSIADKEIFNKFSNINIIDCSYYEYELPTLSNLPSYIKGLSSSTTSTTSNGSNKSTDSNVSTTRQLPIESDCSVMVADTPITKELCIVGSSSTSTCCYVMSSDTTKKLCLLESTPIREAAKTNIIFKYGSKSIGDIYCSSGFISFALKIALYFALILIF